MDLSHTSIRRALRQMLLTNYFSKMLLDYIVNWIKFISVTLKYASHIQREVN